MFEFRYLQQTPIIDAAGDARLGGNVNGPSLIAAPGWLEHPPARYLLYFAHHEGDSIRLATSDALTGPWRLQPPPLSLADSLFAERVPRADELDARARELIAAGADGNYPHIASPDAWVDHQRRQIRLYYHGRLPNGLQRTRVALSDDGLEFQARDEILANSYLRLFQHRGWYYALAMPARLYRSRDGLTGFEAGPQLTAASIRHHALLRHQQRWYVFWTRVGDAPERILVSRLHTDGAWQRWHFGDAVEVHRARQPWEGADLEPRPSAYGALHQRANELRDPAIFEESGRIYLLYTVAGEQGIAIGELIVS